MARFYDAGRLLTERPPPGFRLGLHAFAKINLGLSVGPLQADGFHEVFTVFQTVNLADTVWARPARHGLRLRVVRRGPARAAGLPIAAGRGNLVLRAARLAREAFGAGAAAELLLVKRVPAGSGLGGGSSDAAATLRLLARLWRRPLPRARHRTLAARLGSDCAFFVDGGRAAARGRGERLRAMSVPCAERIVLLLPRRGISTARAYRLLDISKRLTPPAVPSNLSAPRGPHSRSRHARSLMPNELEEVVRRHYPDVDDAISLLVQQGVADTQMSGSGSAVFGLLPSSLDARSFVRRLRGRPFSVVAARFRTSGSVWCR